RRGARLGRGHRCPMRASGNGRLAVVPATVGYSRVMDGLQARCGTVADCRVEPSRESGEVAAIRSVRGGRTPIPVRRAVESFRRLGGGRATALVVAGRGVHTSRLLSVGEGVVR